MNIYNINDVSFKNSSLYQNFMRENSGSGFLNIRAYAANQAIPINGLKVVIQTTYQDKNIIVFEGLTNQSGVIENIKLPAPKITSNNLANPASIQYDIVATYEPDNINKIYQLRIYDNITVIQNISIVPNTIIKAGGFFGG